MKENQVPQDQSPSYDGHKKLLYAVDEKGHYKEVQSNGWEVENFATQMAIEDINRQAEQAYSAVQSGTLSPLSYHMCKHRMDIITLSQVSGFYQWQIRRHLKPAIFQRLSRRKLNTYCEIFNMSVIQLTSLPE